MLMKTRGRQSVAPVYQIQRPALADKELRSQQDALERDEKGFHSKVLEELARSPRLGGGRPLGVPHPPFANFDPYAQAQRIAFLTPVHKAFEMLQPRYGRRTLSPPYDGGWSVGVGDPVAHWDGRAFTMATEGSSTSGFSLHLESPVRAFCTVDFHGTYKYSWASFEDRPHLRVSGGLGRCVYRGSDATPTGVARSTLFTLNGPRAFSGDQGEGDISSLYIGGPTYPFGVFHSHLEPVSFLMEPNVRYTVWLWCWQAATGVEGAPFLSFMSCDVPVVTIETSAPVFPPIH